MTERTASDAGRMVYLSAALAIIWVLLAWWRPTTTWHLGPLLVSLTPALVHRSVGSLSTGAALGTAVNGLINASLAAAVLIAFDKLRGPVLPPFPNVITEVIALVILGAIGGFAVAVFRREDG